MTELQRQIAVIKMLDDYYASHDLPRTFTEGMNVQITLRGIIAYLEVTNQTEKAKEIFKIVEYTNEEILDAVYLDLNLNGRQQVNGDVIRHLSANLNQQLGDDYLPNFIRRQGFVRNDIERSIREAFIDRFMEITGANKTNARYLRLNISRGIVNVSWDTVRDKELLDSYIIKYLQATKSSELVINGDGERHLSIPELNLLLNYES